MTLFNELLLIVLSLSAGFFSEVPVGDVAVPERTAEGIILEVIDGDTIIADIDGRREFVRYIGIDTPERGREGAPDECFAAEAAKANSELVSGKTAVFIADADNRDKYNRLLRYVYVNDVLVQEALLNEGFARTLPIKPNIRHADKFRMYEKAAQDARVGMWGTCKR